MLTMGVMAAIPASKVLAEIAEERIRQDSKWGQPNHPLVDPLLRDRPHTRMAEEYEIPTALRATQACQRAAYNGQCTWLHILVEEVSEFMAEAQHGDDESGARAEAIQIAAVAIAIVEAIDRRRK